MTEFILGFPTGKTQTADNLIQYTNMQDATASTSCMLVYDKDLDDAKAKFLRIFNKANSAIANPGIVQSVLDINADSEKAAKFLRYLYDRMCASYENSGLLGNVLMITWDGVYLRRQWRQHYHYRIKNSLKINNIHPLKLKTMATAKKKIQMVDINAVKSHEFLNRRKAKEDFDIYAGDASKITGDKIVLTIDIEDKGQDLSYLVIEYYPDYALGYVTNSGPYQTGMYKGQCVLSGKPKKGGYILLSEAPGKEVIKLKYKITQIQEWPLHLYHMHIPYTFNRYDYIDSVVVAAYSKEDARTMPANGSSLKNACKSDLDFLNAKNLTIDLLSDTTVVGVGRGVISASFNAG